MRAYKGFNQDLTCTMGQGTFQYEVGKTYIESEAKCARNGFHCVEEPIEVLRWYPNGRYCMVEASGDVHEDGSDKISCTEMTILKELTLQELGMLECIWIQLHAERECSQYIKKKKGNATGEGIVIVRGKNPKAAGDIGSTLFLLKEGKGTKEIEYTGVYHIDGKEFKPDTYYLVDGRECQCEKKN